MSKLYRVHEFAGLAGVTVKALYHYDRLGLLKPGRSGAGYRMYADRDLERLEQIIALKFLGIPLKQIAAVLERAALELPDALRMQRQAIEEKQALLGRAIRAIRRAEEALEPGKPADPAILKRIIEVIDMQDDIDAMKKYYSTAEAWEQRRRYHEEGPSPEWKELYRDVLAALEEDPASETAQALADRWLNLSLRAWSGDPAVQTPNVTAWMDREHWPAAMKERIAKFRIEEVTGFIKQAALSSRRKYFSQEAWAKVVEMRDDLRKQAAEDLARCWQASVDLFRDVEASLAEDPAGEPAQALAARWLALVDSTSGGHPEVKDGVMKVWADRRNWTATLRWQMESLYMATSERFEKAADFIERALAPLTTRPPTAQSSPGSR
jgi:DNA-binding transcriptional MerR regulator